MSLLRRHRHNLKPEQQTRLARYFVEHPAVEAVWRFKEKLTMLLLKKHRTQAQCRRRFLRSVAELRASQLAPLVTLGEKLGSWAGEIVTMWRVTRNNGITEGFHTRMEVLQRQAYGFRNIANYRLAKAMCSRVTPG